MDETYKIGIDLGGTKIESVILSPDRSERFRKRIETPKTGKYEDILRSLEALIAQTVKEIPGGAGYTIGIGIPGSIETVSQKVQNANTTCLIGHPLKADIENLLGRQVGMENDANCFTMAEAVSGAGRGYDMVFGIIMGTGCGGGICIDGTVRTGRHGICGEWGHFAIDPLGEKCYCGNIGCIETKISGGGVERRFRQQYGKDLSMAQITDGFRNGDRDCRPIFKQFLEDFGRSLGGLISILDPDVVVLGGGLSYIDELYTKGVENVRKYAFHQGIKTPVVRNRLGDSAGVIGAAWIGK